MKPWAEEYLKTIGEIEAHDAQLSVAERAFVVALRKQVEAETAVSRYKAVRLNELWERVTS